VDEMLKKCLVAADVHQIQNVMGRYEYYHVSNLQEETVSLFSKREDVKVEIANLGIYDGQAGLKRFFLGANLKHTDPHVAGNMFLHTLTTPVIEVAGDGKTAQGVWFSPGIESSPERGDEWCWVKYGIDFIQENGTWKIWHFRMYHIFKCPPTKGPSEAEPKSRVAMSPEIAPDRSNAEEWIFSKTAVFENVPEPPIPYETWDDERAYIK